MRGGAFWLSSRRSTLAALVGLILIGCAGAPKTVAPTSEALADNWTMLHVERAQRALSEYRLSLRPRTTSIVIHDDPAAFVAATGQTEPALRAWTTFDRIHLLHPRFWGDDSEATRTERLTHELCHAALMHHFADEAAARAARIPRFFTEGACSVVAEQERMPLALVLVHAGGVLPLTVDAFTRDPDVAYGAALALARTLAHDFGPTVFTLIMQEAARDGSAGCVERALLALTAAPNVPALWQRVVDTAADPT